ncbi:cysteine synthase A [Terasakiella sp. A23]|uniref:cysteine synthase A n=1 Tax=Terasakiella sp. FCG-A23 TaxID=3080561 RepID=UPI0029535998|nr:cysteine synthase A [Terasakiella sp. A23]MDV7340010.1 cysteine synthase A [Terasakiella sp. A23]
MTHFDAHPQKSSSMIGRGRVFDNILQTVGNTPIVRLERLCANHGAMAEILAKIESFNPCNSIKDRSALAMIEGMEAEGRIKPETEIIEATSGNNGVACAWACAMKNIPLTICIPEHMSIERRKMMALFGANVVLTKKELGTKGAIDKAKELLSQNENALMLGQFENPANPNIHANTTAEEIWNDTNGQFDVVVAGIGTGGTFSGLAKLFKSRNPDVKMIAVEPASCPVLSKGEAGVHKIQGLSSGHVPDVLRTDLIDEIITVENETAIEMARTVARDEAIAVGISSGAAAWTSLQVAKREDMKGKRIVTVFADFAERYISTDLFDF